MVKERLGHGSITTTQAYVHTRPGADSAALAALDVIRGRRDLDFETEGLPAEQGGEAVVAVDDKLAQMRRMLNEMKQLLERGTGTA